MALKRCDNMTHRPNKICDMTARGTGGCSQVENTGPWLYVDVIDATQYGCTQLAPEGVPFSVFYLLFIFLKIENFKRIYVSIILIYRSVQL